MDVTSVLATLTICVGVIAWLIAVRFRRGPMIAPFSIFIIILVSIYGVRPLLMPDSPESTLFYGYIVSASGYELATLLGFVGMLAFVGGYGIMRLVSQKKRQVALLNPPEFVHPGDGAPRRSFIAAWVLLAVWPAALIAVGGVGFIAMVFQGRNVETSATLANVPALVFAIPVVSCVTIAATRFHYERFASYTRAQSLMYWIIGALAVIPPSALGTRRFLIPSVVIVVAGVLTKTWFKKVKPVWILAAVAAFIVLAVFPFVRSSGSRIGGSTDLVGAMIYYFQNNGLRGALDGFFLSFDTEMLNWVAYFGPKMGTKIPFGLGRGTVGELIALPIPDAISPYPTWNNYLLQKAFGAGCAGLACPVPSIVGVLYTDLALPGLAIGMFILGLMAARFDLSFLHAKSIRYTAVLLLVAGFAVVFVRGNSSSQLWYGFQCFVVWFIADLYVTKRAPRERPADRRRRLQEQAAYLRSTTPHATLEFELAEAQTMTTTKDARPNSP